MLSKRWDNTKSNILGRIKHQFNLGNVELRGPQNIPLLSQRSDALVWLSSVCTGGGTSQLVIQTEEVPAERVRS